MTDRRIFTGQRKQDPERQCHGKKRHRTLHDGQKALLGSGFPPEETNIYRCPHCSYWHLGQRVDAKRKGSDTTDHREGI